MEENPAALECLISFYINMKHFLKTRLLDERTFLHEMAKHCNERGFDAYSDMEIKNAWIELVVKYQLLKTKSPGEKESWKYFEILDSCYEKSDFQGGVHAKFSEDMVWFLIECFLKRKTFGKKRNDILNEVHKDFVCAGYIHITKRDIENKWKYLNLKYNKVKNDPERFKKFPYVQALNVFHEKNESRLANMGFTEDLTKTLIKFFTDNKISCIIQGYESDEVLNKVQSNFKELGFYFSIEAIKEKWRKLTNIYKYLLCKRENKTTWTYFNPMRDHFKNKYLLVRNKKDLETFSRTIDSKPRCPRPRSKSVGAALRGFSIESENRKSLSPERICVNENEYVKKPFDDPDTKVLPRKRGRPRKNQANHISKIKTDDIPHDMHLRLRSKSVCLERKQESVVESISDDESEKLLGNKRKLIKRSIVGNEADNVNKKFKPSDGSESFEKNKSNNVISGNGEKNINVVQNEDVKSESDSTKRTEIINKQKNEIWKNDVPFITKQFSDNEFLPFKKRLRTGIDSHVSAFGKIKKFETRVTNEEKFPAEKTPMEKDTNETLQNDETNDKLNKLLDNVGLETLKNYELLYNNWQYKDLSKDVCEENTKTHNAKVKNPCLLVVVEMDGANNNLKNIDPLRAKNEVKLQTESKELNVSRTESSNNNSEVISKVIDTTNLQIEGYNHGFYTTNNVQVSMCCAKLNGTNGDAVNNKNSEPDDHCYCHSEKDTSQTLHETSSVIEISDDETEVNETSVEDQVIEKEVNFLPTLNENITDSSVKINTVNLDNNLESEISADHIETSIVYNNNDENQSDCYNENKTCEVQALTTSNISNIKQQFVEHQESYSNVNLVVRSVTNICTTTSSANVAVSETLPRFKFVSHVVKPPTKSSEEIVTEISESSENIDGTSLPLSQKVRNFQETHVVSENRSERTRNDEFENESVISEVVEEAGLRDNLLATVIDFQEQNNQEFIEIKNLMKQNNLLQRETNRLLRLLLEKQ